MIVQPWQVLASVGIALVLAEIFTPSFFALPAGLAFLATAGLALIVHDWVVLAVLLAVNLGIVYATFHRFVWPRLQRTSTRSNAEGMSGKIAVVSAAVDPTTGAGEVKLYGDTWKTISKQPFSVGARVRIVRTEGNRVVIEPAVAG